MVLREPTPRWTPRGRAAGVLRCESALSGVNGQQVPANVADCCRPIMGYRVWFHEPRPVVPVKFGCRVALLSRRPIGFRVPASLLPRPADRHSPEKHARPRDSTCEVIATTFLSIATQARRGNHRGRPPSQTTVSHKAGLGSRDAATRNPMGLRDSKATRQPNFTGTTGRGSWNQTL